MPNTIGDPKSYPGGISLYKYRGVTEIERLMKAYSLGEDPTLYFSHTSEFNDPYDFRTPNVAKKSKIMREKTLECLPMLLSRCMIGSGDRDELRQKLSEFIPKVSKQIAFNLDWDTWIQTICEKAIEAYSLSPVNVNISIRCLGHALDKWIDTEETGFRNLLRVCSFSEDNDSILMWSYYSNDHKGICYEYSDKLLRNTEVNIGAHLKLSMILYQVNYQDNLDVYREQYMKYIDGELSNPELIKLIFQLGALKSEIWKHENEWRALLINDNNELPSDKGVQVHIVPSCIYLGTKISEEHRAIVCNIAKNREIKVMQMVLDEDTFSLHAEPVNLNSICEEWLKN